MYRDSPERLQKQLIGFFFDGFDVKDGIIIKDRYSPIFQELIRLNVATLKSFHSEKSFDNTTESKVIIRPELGA